MKNSSEILLEMIRQVADALGDDILKKTAFVGGATTGFFITDPYVKESVRLTDDVDIIVDVVGYGKWASFQDELKSKGFTVSPDDDVICRMRLGDLKVDFMPDDEKILGFTNKWYSAGLENAINQRVSENLEIRTLTPPLFIATKLEAYLGRGNDDPMGSRDIEDIINLIDGRAEIASEARSAAPDVRDYIAEQMKELVSHDQFEYAVDGNVRGGSERTKIVYDRIDELASLADEAPPKTP